MDGGSTAPCKMGKQRNQGMSGRREPSGPLRACREPRGLVPPWQGSLCSWLCDTWHNSITGEAWPELRGTCDARIHSFVFSGFIQNYQMSGRQEK